LLIKFCLISIGTTEKKKALSLAEIKIVWEKNKKMTFMCSLMIPLNPLPSTLLLPPSTYRKGVIYWDLKVCSIFD
jgi:hypothetical protein